MRLLSEDDHDDHADEEDEHEDEDPIALKILIMCLLLIAGSFVFFPYADKICKKNSVEPDKNDKKKGCCKGQMFSIANCFAAGMLLSLSVCHILPESTEMYSAYVAY